jgi:hypothetical protein
MQAMKTFFWFDGRRQSDNVGLGRQFRRGDSGLIVPLHF